MLKLSKAYSEQNYPVQPQTSSVRKLTVKAQVSSIADLSASYIIIKNGLSTVVNGAQVVRNVGWGQEFAQDNVWQYPSTCQIKTATLTCGGLTERLEDVNVMAVNMAVWTKNSAHEHKEANLSSWGFQHLPEGPKTPTADATETIRSQGLWRSVFLDEQFGVSGANNTKTAATYKTVSSIIPLGDIFGSAKMAKAVKVNEVLVELQFEDQNQILAELVNFPTDTSADPTPFPWSSMEINGASLTNGDGSVPPVAPADAAAMLTKEYNIATTTVYKHVRDVPLFVGQPICLWKTGAPAVVGANIQIIKGLSVPIAGGVCTITFGPYAIGGEIIRTAGAPITPAQYFAELYAAGPPAVFPVVGLTCISDPVLSAGNDTVYTMQDAGKLSKYTVEGLELVICETPGAQASNTIEYVQMLRDTDTIPALQVYYSKSFMLDPGCVAAFAMFPPKYDPAGPQTNLMSLSYYDGVAEGLSFRNLLNGVQLYNRDITFSSASDAVEPLYTHRVIMALAKMGVEVQNLDPTIMHMAKNGVSQVAMVAEPVNAQGAPQQLAVRLRFDTNAADRTIYVYKAVLAKASI